MCVLYKNITSYNVIINNKLQFTFKIRKSEFNGTCRVNLVILKKIINVDNHTNRIKSVTKQTKKHN